MPSVVLDQCACPVVPTGTLRVSAGCRQPRFQPSLAQPQVMVVVSLSSRPNRDHSSGIADGGDRWGACGAMT